MNKEKYYIYKDFADVHLLYSEHIIEDEEINVYAVAFNEEDGLEIVNEFWSGSAEYTFVFKDKELVIRNYSKSVYFFDEEIETIHVLKGNKHLYDILANCGARPLVEYNQYLFIDGADNNGELNKMIIERDENGEFKTVYQIPETDDYYTLLTMAIIGSETLEEYLEQILEVDENDK